MSEQAQNEQTFWELSEKEKGLLHEAIGLHHIKVGTVTGAHRPNWAREDPPRDEKGRFMSVFEAADDDHRFTITVFHNRHGWKSELEWADEEEHS